MVPNIPTDIFYANAFYARQEDFISYEDLGKYRKILVRGFFENNYSYFSFDDFQGFWPYPIRVEEHIYEINNVTFIKSNDGVLLATYGELDRKWIEKVNYYYPEDIKEMLRQSWQKFGDMKLKQKTKKKSR